MLKPQKFLSILFPNFEGGWEGVNWGWDNFSLYVHFLASLFTIPFLKDLTYVPLVSQVSCFTIILTVPSSQAAASQARLSILLISSNWKTFLIKTKIIIIIFKIQTYTSFSTKPLLTQTLISLIGFVIMSFVHLLV